MRGLYLDWPNRGNVQEITFQKWWQSFWWSYVIAFWMLEARVFFFLPFLTFRGCRDALSNPAFFPMSRFGYWGLISLLQRCKLLSAWLCWVPLHGWTASWVGHVTWPYLAKINIGPALAFYQVLGMQSIHDIFVGLSYIWHFEIDVWFDCLMPGRRTASCTKYLKAFRGIVPCHESMQLPWIWHVIVYSLDFWVLTVQLFLCHGKIIIWGKRLASAPMIWRLSSPGVVQSFGYLLRQKWRVDYTSPTWCQHFQSNGYRWYWMNMYENGWKWQFTELQNSVICFKTHPCSITRDLVGPLFLTHKA